MKLLVRLLVILGSGASIGFGIWHFFVPEAWKWYSYIDSAATELVLAVGAINVFFSLCLVLFGVINILLICANKANRYSVIVVLGATCILWITRVLLQLIYPQGSMTPALQYGMLSAFVFIALCYILSFVQVLSRKPD